MIRSNNKGIDVEAVLKMIEVINLFRTFFFNVQLPDIPL
jgi:hypothetical protein